MDTSAPFVDKLSHAGQAEQRVFSSSSPHESAVGDIAIRLGDFSFQSPVHNALGQEPYVPFVLCPLTNGSMLMNCYF